MLDLKFIWNHLAIKLTISILRVIVNDFLVKIQLLAIKGRINEMKRTPLLTTVICLVLSIALVSCGGYVKKDELEKQLSDQKMDIEQKVQLAQDSAATANDKADKALAVTKTMDKYREDILTTLDGKIDSALVSAKGDMDKYNEEFKRMAQAAADRALADANSNAMAEDEKVKMMAKEAADKAMTAAMEADKRAQEAAKQAELAKTLPKTSEPTIFTVYFDSGKINIKPEGVAEIEKAASMIKSDSSIKVKVEGNADNVKVMRSKFGSNWVLSQARADAVMQYLVDKLGVSADAIKASVGNADYKPAAANDKTNKWQNRRVDITIIQ
jgi:chemotaxis protein MotB